MAITRFCLSSLYLLSHFRSSDVTTFDNGRHHAPILCLFVTKEIYAAARTGAKLSMPIEEVRGMFLGDQRSRTYLPCCRRSRRIFSSAGQDAILLNVIRSHFTHFRPHSYGANSGLHSLLALKKIGPEPKIGPGGSIMVSDIMVPRPY